MMKIAGVDISAYAYAECLPSIKPFMWCCSAELLPFGDKEFDLVISINTVHNLDRAGCIKALQEIERVGNNAFISVDAYRTEEQKEAMLAWNLTALTILSADEWKDLFREAGYTGDYSFWMP